MIYCVIPPELEDSLYAKLVEYYKDNPNVTVIVDRRQGDDRRSGPGPHYILIWDDHLAELPAAERSKLEVLATSAGTDPRGGAP